MTGEIDAPPRKRVRTGCLTCRGRRRKCDEGKPECSNCKSKNLTCRYGVNVTFVQSKFQQFAEAESPTKAVQFTEPEPQLATTTRQRYSSPDDLFHAEDDRGFALPELDLFIDGRHHGHTPNLSTPTQVEQGDSRSTSVKSHEEARLQYEAISSSQTNAKRDQYETELLTFYRYHVAPILDLGLGSLSFGIQTIVDSVRSEAVYYAVLAIANSWRAALVPDLRVVDEATSTSCAHLANQAMGELQHPESTTAKTLLICRTLCTAPIEAWSSLNPEVVNLARCAPTQTEGWNLLARLHLSTVLVGAGSSKVGHSLPPPSQLSQIQREPSHHLCRALWILEQNLSYLNHDQQHLGSQAPSPVQAWLLHWQDVQDWYGTRSEDMRQLLELSDADLSDLGVQDQLSFPCIIFSTACAVVANVAHHLASMILLQRKPRLAKATAEHDSSTSALWHSQRILGIVTSAAEAEIWDCFLVAALVYTVRSLSHSKQIQAAANTLARISDISCLQLASTIEQIRIDKHS